MYFPVDEKTNMHRGISKDAFVSAEIELLDQTSGEVINTVEIKGNIVPLTANIQEWNDKFTEKYEQSMTKEIAEMMLHKSWYVLKRSA